MLSSLEPARHRAGRWTVNSPPGYRPRSSASVLLAEPCSVLFCFSRPPPPIDDCNVDPNMGYRWSMTTTTTTATTLHSRCAVPVPLTWLSGNENNNKERQRRILGAKSKKASDRSANAAFLTNPRSSHPHPLAELALFISASWTGLTLTMAIPKPGYHMA